MQTSDRLRRLTGTGQKWPRRLLPLETLNYEHLRQKCLCNLLGRIVDDLYASDTIKSAAWALDYLENVLPLHVSDETEDLVPRLLEHDAADEAVGKACRALVHEHESDRLLAAKIKVGLELLSRARPLPRPLDFIVDVLTFEENLRRHVAWENAEFLPLARHRLASEDLSSLGSAMARRHGLF